VITPQTCVCGPTSDTRSTSEAQIRRDGCRAWNPTPQTTPNIEALRERLIGHVVHTRTKARAMVEEFEARVRAEDEQPTSIRLRLLRQTQHSVPSVTQRGQRWSG